GSAIPPLAQKQRRAKDGAPNFCGERRLACDEGAALARGEQRDELRPGCFYADTVFLAEGVYLAVLDELVGPADADYGDVAVHLFQSFHDCRAEAAGFGVVLKGDEGGYAV